MERFHHKKKKEREKNKQIKNHDPKEPHQGFHIQGKLNVGQKRQLNFKWQLNIYKTCAAIWQLRWNLKN